ncbi:MAG: glycoside hydrolase family 2 protein [Lachnospiraceae bacterium]|nr:glycoside hydrolase family 2 protein [Lachnospiraceae bacterium]
MERLELNRGWKFAEEFSEEMIAAPMQGGTDVTLPHTVKETPFHYFDEGIYQMVSCYQKTVRVPHAWRGKRITLTLLGAGHEATVYVDGNLAGVHKCGYTAYTVDISRLVEYGEDNLITVRLDSRETLDQPPFGFVIDYMTFGGLYRGACITVQESVCLTDVFAMPGFAAAPETCGFLPEDWEEHTFPGTLKSWLYLSDEAREALAQGRLKVRQTLTPAQGGEETVLFDSKILPEAHLRADGALPLKVTRPFAVRPWDIESPSLYTLRTELWDGEACADAREETVGFREAEFTAEGFFLNGRKVKIRGLNRHQCYPYMGYAAPASLQEEDARILKEELCVNAVRTSHYPQEQSFISACDRLGLLVFTEIPGWQHIGGDAWKAQAIENTRDMVVQYRNHPSIILWGVRINESQDCTGLYAETNVLARSLDPTRQTGGVRCNEKMELLEDVYTFNDFSFDGDRKASGVKKKKNVSPDALAPYMITEYAGHMYPTKAFDWEEHRTEHVYRHAKVMEGAAADPEICGSFGWCMNDYPTHKDFGSGDRVCYHGVLDQFRNFKPAAYLYASQGEKEPVLEVTSSMDIGEHPASVRGTSYILTNADSVRTYKGDTFLREYTRADSEFPHLPHGPIEIRDFVGEALKDEGYDEKTTELIRDCMNEVALHGYKMTPALTVAFARLSAKGFTMKDANRLFSKYVGDWGGASKSYRFEAVKNGEVVRTVVKEPMDGTVRLEVRLSRVHLVERGTWDAAAIRVRALDANGNVLPFYMEPVRVTVQGPLAVIGPDIVPMRGGLGGTYVRTVGESGEAAVTLSVPGAEPVTVRLTVRRESVAEG